MCDACDLEQAAVGMFKAADGIALFLSLVCQLYTVRPCTTAMEAGQWPAVGWGCAVSLNSDLHSRFGHKVKRMT